MGRSTSDAIPQTVEQQQWQLVRLPGAPAFHRGLQPSRRPLGARRHDDGDCRFLRRQAAELAERPCAASRWKHRVHRSAVWRPACRGPSGRTGRLGQSTRPAQPAHRRAERRHDRWQETRTAERVYRWDPSGHLDVAITEDQLKDPNGICFSPDYKMLYVCSTGKGPGDSHNGGTRTIWAFDVQGTKGVNGRDFLDHTVDGVKCSPTACALTCSAICGGASGPLGYAGVFVYNARQDYWAHSAAGGLREPVLWRPEAQPVVHDGEPVGLHVAGEHAGRCTGIVCLKWRRCNRVSDSGDPPLASLVGAGKHPGDLGNRRHGCSCCRSVASSTVSSSRSTSPAAASTAAISSRVSSWANQSHGAVQPDQREAFWPFLRAAEAGNDLCPTTRPCGRQQ